MSRISICNKALNHIGESKTITNIDSEKSQEAKACRRFYDDARRETLRDFPWPFAMIEDPLPLVKDNTGVENARFGYFYDYPPDCVRLISVIIPGAPPDGRSEPYKNGHNAMGRALIMTDVKDAVGIYTGDVLNTMAFPSDFQKALEYKLAQFIAPTLARGSRKNESEKMERLYEVQISKAEAASANEGDNQVVPESGLLRSRI